MKVPVSVFAIVLFAFGTALATPHHDVITFPAKMGDVQFNHKKHQEIVKNCKECHTNTPGKIAGLDKDKAHKLCWDCHKAKSQGKGPTGSNCKGCHKKK